MTRRIAIALSLAAIVLLAVFGLHAAFSGGSSGSTFEAVFQDARGLVKGNDVRVDGAPAGTRRERVASGI